MSEVEKTLHLPINPLNVYLHESIDYLKLCLLAQLNIFKVRVLLRPVPIITISIYRTIMQLSTSSGLHIDALTYNMNMCVIIISVVNNSNIKYHLSIIS